MTSTFMKNYNTKQKFYKLVHIRKAGKHTHNKMDKNKSEHKDAVCGERN